MIDEPWSASEIIMDQLGIEPDYIEYLMLSINQKNME